jgi:hypothetical protein
VAIRVTHFLSQDANGPTHILIHLHDRLMGGDVAGEGNAGSPGSGGASPYQNHLFPIVLKKVANKRSFVRQTTKSWVYTDSYPLQIGFVHCLQMVASRPNITA